MSNLNRKLQDVKLTLLTLLDLHIDLRKRLN